IPGIVNLMRRRIFSQRPDLVPKSLHEQNEILRAHNLAFEPWANPDEKIESRDMRLERLGLPYIEHSVRNNAEVLFYPGCQAEERAQEVKEAAKVILHRLGVSFTLLDEMTCCSLPALLIGDEDKSLELSSVLKKKIDEIGVKKIVTTCAGCTSNLSEVAERDGWKIPIYHLLEFLAEEIGFDTLSQAFNDKATKPVTVTVHDPCHLIRHTSRRVLEYAHQILHIMPFVEVKESSAHDSCCGGGGLVGRHSPDIARGVVRENVDAIIETSADKVVTPCPLCTAQLEESLFRSGSAIEVDDMTVFIAQRIA
ncbi:MAG: (Fe-S)-binding protein, partial [Candidatus Thorarchaeota archaeon]